MVRGNEFFTFVFRDIDGFSVSTLNGDHHGTLSEPDTPNITPEELEEITRAGEAP